MDTEMKKYEKFLAAARTNVEKLKESLMAFINKFKEVIKRVWGAVKKFFINNKEMFEKIFYVIEKKKKYQKKIINRQLLYLKRRSLGRSL